MEGFQQSHICRVMPLEHYCLVLCFMFADFCNGTNSTDSEFRYFTSLFSSLGIWRKSLDNTNFFRNMKNVYKSKKMLKRKESRKKKRKWVLRKNKMKNRRKMKEWGIRKDWRRGGRARRWIRLKRKKKNESKKRLKRKN